MVLLLSRKARNSVAMRSGKAFHHEEENRGEEKPSKPF
jgi:hypothetical protein